MRERLAASHRAHLHICITVETQFAWRGVGGTDNGGTDNAKGAQVSDCVNERHVRMAGRHFRYIAFMETLM